MAKIILVTGGARSGKSDFAQQQAESLAGPRCFVATCEVYDPEMAERVEKHRRARRQGDWYTIEEPCDLEHLFLTETGYHTFLVDCLTLWVSNIYESASRRGDELNEDVIEDLVRKTVATIRKKECTVLLVTNEVGMGIVPENRVARKYRDLVGRCNRVCAELADEAFFICSGLPVRLK